MPSPCGCKVLIRKELLDALTSPLGFKAFQCISPLKARDAFGVVSRPVKSRQSGVEARQMPRHRGGGE